ncbi:hypothetical protein SPRG_12404 [Saprolegnia parasitica CBS 223.65]|uniref:Uncharacterized protein n=1 Tax=Saprolegnia parasitica (strain CBS 223.65) TaxID=695850 RepID=A0A067BT11_SAPPC|nr:hypothetical protein SPRG_12404 [Saprolegnia parasitica CBS 223.65]KDO21398.1 hypothetical protein SPRG_12404 [Saprolegnia parasitica CBS 223.65]|eukprot:XP_012207846.1 hypothetical protein SPRG_12404 [Saprolegnia parasitica CBS 223.65]
MSWVWKHFGRLKSDPKKAPLAPLPTSYAVRAWLPSWLPVRDCLVTVHKKSQFIESPASRPLQRRRNPTPPQRFRGRLDHGISKDNADYLARVRINFVDFLEREQRSTVSPASLKKIACRSWVHLFKLVVVNLWWHKNGCHHRLVVRIAAHSNAYQERVFSLCKLIDSPLPQNIGNTKFEMLLVLALDKRTMSAERELVKVLEATTTASESATKLIHLNGNIDNDETEASFIVVETLRSAAKCYA